jgi:hypothetical protein
VRIELTWRKHNVSTVRVRIRAERVGRRGVGVHAHVV